MPLIQNKIQDDSAVIIELHPQEIELIRALRNQWRFGEVTIIMRNGIPERLARVHEFIDLKSASKK